jgi:flagellin-specific chaperone FliS
MSIFDDNALEKVDYEVIYKKQFENTNQRIDRIEHIIPCLSNSIDVQKTKDELHNMIYDLHASIQDIRNNMSVMRDALNTILPENKQIYFE